MSESLADVVHEAVERAKADEVQIDPATVMAEHYDDGIGCAAGCLTDWPCDAYRMAEALAASEAKVADAWDEGWKAGARDQMTGRALTENPYR